MILDTSAVIAILWRERGYEELLGKIEKAEALGIATPTLAELGLVLTARLDIDPIGMIARFLQEFEVSQIPFGADHWREAVVAFGRFGKGRHAARLNFGDCLTYAAARLAGQRLLCVGDDFPRTDLELA